MILKWVLSSFPFYRGGNRVFESQAAYPRPPNSRSEGAQVWPGDWTTELAKGQERNQAKGSGRGSNAGNRTW